MRDCGCWRAQVYESVNWISTLVWVSNGEVSQHPSVVRLSDTRWASQLLSSDKFLRAVDEKVFLTTASLHAVFIFSSCREVVSGDLSHRCAHTNNILNQSLYFRWMEWIVSTTTPEACGCWNPPEVSSLCLMRSFLARECYPETHQIPRCLEVRCPMPQQLMGG